MTADEAIAIVMSRARGRTRYEGQEPFVDEILVAEIIRLRDCLIGEGQITVRPSDPQPGP